MKFGIHIEPEGARYEEIAVLARAVEEAGFDIVARSDHYLPHERPVAPLGPTDAWTTMAGLARETHRVQLSVMMSNPSFRHPAALAVIMAQVHDMSRGRVELGLGAGWFERELEAFGFQMPDTEERRFRRREEQITVLKGIWSASEAEPFSFEGDFYFSRGNAGLGRESSPPFPHLVLALTDAQQTVVDAVRHASECNVPFATLDETAAQFKRTDEECLLQGRASDSIGRSVTVLACAGNSEADIERRAAVIGTGAAHVETAHFVGSPSRVREGLSPFLDLGIDRMYIQVRDVADLDHIHILSEIVDQLN